MRYAKISALDNHVDVREHLLHPLEAFAMMPQKIVARDVLGHREGGPGYEGDMGRLREQSYRGSHREGGS